MAQTRNAKGQFAKQKAEPVSKKSGRISGTRLNSAPAGASGLQRTNGLVFEEFLKELQGQQGARIFQEMRDNDDVIGALFFALEMFNRRVHWFVDPATDDEKGEADAKFLRECKEDMSHTWSDFIAEVMSMLQHGWSWFEVIYKIRENEDDEWAENQPSKFNDGRIGWRKFEIRSQDSLDRWDFDDEGGIRGLFQRPAPDYEEKYVPIQKSLLFRTTVKKNNPEGRSILRNAYRPWYFKKRFEEIEGVGVERDLAGLPFAEVPAQMMRDDASDADKETLASIVELVKNVRRDEQEGVVWPQVYDQNGNPQYKFSLMNSGGTRQFNVGEIITRCSQRIAMVVLADFILLGNDGGSGSFAMATNKSGLFQSALSAWLDVIQSVLNDYAVPRLFRLNRIPGPYPRFRHEEVQKPSLADLATFVAALAGAGAQLFPDVDLENHFRGIAQLPLRESKDESKSDEDELREKKLQSEIAAARFAIQNPGGPPNQPLGKDPNSKEGAPTKTTGRVKSKLPPQQRRRTKAVDASENVSKAVTTIVKNPKCKFCAEKATAGQVWAEGMAVIPHCPKHKTDAVHKIVVGNKDEVVKEVSYPRNVIVRKKKTKHNPEYERETELIRSHKDRWNKPHKFKAAEWTHPNGHPRCIRCGSEEPINGKCHTTPTKAEQRAFSEKLEREFAS
jgi:hypothetical protein